MGSVTEFGRELDLILRPLFGKDSDRIEILFNVTLVKFKQRPSTFSYYRETENKLKNSADFMQFIREDPDLKAGHFFTENPNHSELVIYNRKYESLFKEINIFDKGHEEIHLTRGRRLGFPHVTAQFQAKDLVNVSIFATVNCDDGGRMLVSVYGYMCPYTVESINDATIIWDRFSLYAKCLGYGMTLQLSK